MILTPESKKSAFSSFHLTVPGNTFIQLSTSLLQTFTETKGNGSFLCEKWSGVVDNVLMGGMA